MTPDRTDLMAAGYTVCDLVAALHDDDLVRSRSVAQTIPAGHLETVLGAATWLLEQMCIGAAASFEECTFADVVDAMRSSLDSIE